MFEATRRADLDGLAAWGFDTPGPLRDRLNASVLLGDKTATSSVYDRNDEPVSVGALELLLDSNERPFALIEITRVEVRPIADIDLEVAVAEGEGYESAAAWRAYHEAYFLAELASDGAAALAPFEDDTEILVEWFRVIERF